MNPGIPPNTPSDRSPRSPDTPHPQDQPEPRREHLGQPFRQLGSYRPQLGDRVWYFKQGHAEFLRVHKLLAPPGLLPLLERVFERLPASSDGGSGSQQAFSVSSASSSSAAGADSEAGGADGEGAGVLLTLPGRQALRSNRRPAQAPSPGDMPKIIRQPIRFTPEEQRLRALLGAPPAWLPDWTRIPAGLPCRVIGACVGVGVGVLLSVSTGVSMGVRVLRVLIFYDWSACVIC